MRSDLEMFAGKFLAPLHDAEKLQVDVMKKVADATNKRAKVAASMQVIKAQQKLPNYAYFALVLLFFTPSAPYPFPHNFRCLSLALSSLRTKSCNCFTFSFVKSLRFHMVA